MTTTSPDPAACAPLTPSPTPPASARRFASLTPVANDAIAALVPGKRPTIALNWELYASYLDNCDLPDDDKKACIETLWMLAVCFVDLGFDLNAVQHVTDLQSDSEKEALLP